MSLQTFFDNFPVLAGAPNSVPKLRELILELAVQGKLAPQNLNDEPASTLLERIKSEKARFKNKKSHNTELSLPFMEVVSPFIVPNNWQWCRLADFGITQTGTTPPTSKAEYFGNDYPFIKPADITSNAIRYDKDGLSKLGVKVGRLVPANSVLMVSIGGSIGKVGLVDRDCSCNQQINYISLCEGILPRLIYYFLKTPYFQEQVLSLAPSTTLPILSKGKWDLIPLPLPPVEEQKRIVAKVDELMRLCDELEVLQQKKCETCIFLNNIALDKLPTASEPDDFNKQWQLICDNFDWLYSLPENIDGLRQAILQLAIQGKLVQQNPDDEPATVLLEKIINEKTRLIKEGKTKQSESALPIKPDYFPFCLPSNWVSIRLGDCIDLISGQHLNKEEQNDQGIGLPYLTGPADFGAINPIATRWTTTLKVIAKKQDVLITVKGAGVGKTNILDLDKAAIGRQLMALRTILVSYEYIYLLIRASYLKFQGLSIGSTVPGIGREDVLNLKIGLPPIEEQNRIIAKVNQLMTLCDELDTKLRQAEADSAKLMTAAVRHVLENIEQQTSDQPLQVTV